MILGSFVEHVVELMGSVGPIRARPMMGGFMIHCGALPVALVADDRLYLKVDPETRGAFRAAGGEAFSYELRGKRVEMSYWSPPDEALDAPESMEPWARLAVEAAGRARRAAAPGRERRRPGPPARGRRRGRAAPRRR